MKNNSITFDPLAGFKFDYDNQEQIIAEINESQLMGELQCAINRNVKTIAISGLTGQLYGHKAPNGFFRMVCLHE